MLLVVNTFNDIPEVFVPQDRKPALDKALQMSYNAVLVEGHAMPWYQLQGSHGVVLDQKYVTEVLQEVVSAYDL